MTDIEDIERVAKAIHREWARFSIRHQRKHGEETEDEAHERRWATMMPRVRQEFLGLASAAIKAMPVRCDAPSHTVTVGNADARRGTPPRPR